MKIDDDVYAVLSDAEITGNDLKLLGQLARPLYVKTNKVLEALGGKWDRKRGAHTFASDPNDVIANVLLCGEVEVPKDMDFFATPPAVCARMIDAVGAARWAKEGITVLEPSAGDGAIAKAVLRACPSATLSLVELSPKRAAVLESEFPASSVITGDFLAVDLNDFRPPTGADVVLMNPPFSKRQDVRHVEHALSLVRPGGVVVAIMSSGVSFRGDKLTKNFREMAFARGGTMEHLAPGSFKSSGTTVNTVLTIIPG